MNYNIEMVVNVRSNLFRVFESSVNVLYVNRKGNYRFNGLDVMM